jgi:hypothetical protein
VISGVLNENSVDSVVYNFTARMSDANNEAILSVMHRSSTFPHWFSNSLKYCIKKKNQLLRNVRNQIPITITVIFHINISWSKLLLRQVGWLG